MRSTTPLRGLRFSGIGSAVRYGSGNGSRLGSTAPVDPVLPPRSQSAPQAASTAVAGDGAGQPQEPAAGGRGHRGTAIALVVLGRRHPGRAIGAACPTWAPGPQRQTDPGGDEAHAEREVHREEPRVTHPELDGQQERGDQRERDRPRRQAAGPPGEHGRAEHEPRQPHQRDAVATVQRQGRVVAVEEPAGEHRLRRQQHGEQRAQQPQHPQRDRGGARDRRSGNRHDVDVRNGAASAHRPAVVIRRRRRTTPDGIAVAPCRLRGGWAVPTLGGCRRTGGSRAPTN